MHWLFRLLIVSATIVSPDAWDPDAGFIPSWTKLPGVKASASFSTSHTNVSSVLDDNDNTHWTSGSCVPSGFVGNQDNNILHGLCQRHYCSYSSSPNINDATDGDQSYTVATINAVQSRAKFVLNLTLPEDIQFLSVWGIYHGTTNLSVFDTNNIEQQLGFFTKKDNYKQMSYVNINITVVRIQLISSQSFQIKEIAAIGSHGCVSTVTVDLGSSREIGNIRTRHWAGTHSASALDLRISLEGSSWMTVGSLDPEALHAVTTRLAHPLHARFIQLQYQMTLKSYSKVYCWEIDAWDRNSLWGKPINPVPQTNTLRYIMGVNGIWGWGHNTYSNNLKGGEGPDLYSEVASHARNYHSLSWDVSDPDNDPQFIQMAAGKGTNAKSWLNWDQEYGAWKQSHMTIDASVKINEFPQNVWNNPEKSAFEYGRAFAAHFGKDNGNGLIDAIEVGNEPWHYDSNFYSRILVSMAAGVRSVDTQMKVLPGAFFAHAKRSTSNYIGTRVSATAAVNVSVINFHVYSYVTNSSGVRVATFPEHPESSFNGLRNIVRWRNANVPDHPIWVTEWGWDSAGGGEACSFPECVSNTEQSIYGLRGLLILSRSAVEKVHWFFYANTQCSTLYCRSGLTSSKSHNFTKKASFHGFQSFLSLMGNMYFHNVLREDESGYIYLFGSRSVAIGKSFNKPDMLRTASRMVAWKPTFLGDANVSTVVVSLPTGTLPVKAELFTGTGIVKKGLTFNQHTCDLTLQLSPYPQIIQLAHGDLGNIVG